MPCASAKPRTRAARRCPSSSTRTSCASPSCTNLLKQREGNLGEVFGVTRQVAGDVSSALHQSHDQRAASRIAVEFLRQLAGAKALPSIAELEQLWFEMQREMTETGRVVALQGQDRRARGRVARGRGRADRALHRRCRRAVTSSYKLDLGSLTVLPRQPPAEFLEAAEDLQEAQSGYTRGVVDPARGVLIDLYVQRPNWVERVENGESVNYVILAGRRHRRGAGRLAVPLPDLRAHAREPAAQEPRPSDDQQPARARAALPSRAIAARIEETAEIAELRISEAVLHEVPLLERFQAFLRLAVAAGPLLGLIGTVVGMIITFQSITESGSSDPKLMAHGIGTAMIATVLGLGIAIPLLFANAFLATMSRQLVQILDEQSTGLLAETLEKKGV